MFREALKRTIRCLHARFFAPVSMLKDLILFDSSRELIRQHPNPLNRFGRKVFSQTDEDGLTLEILRRIGMTSGAFAEFGVGNGLENNTLVLAALGWTGFWVGGERLAFSVPTSEKPRLTFFREWITRENVLALTRAGLQSIGRTEADVISLDLDGNDLYVAERLLREGVKPKLFIVEINAKFAPPIRWAIEYDARHRWRSDDYFGASLMSFVDLFREHGYFLACCNAHTGSNAFFVADAFKGLFSDVPTDVMQVYSEPRTFLYSELGARLSPRTVEVILQRNLG